VRLEARPGAAPQSYKLRIRPGGIRLLAADEAGFRYGAMTLGQLLASGCRAVQTMDIEDGPDFPVRGVMLDISRDKVPTTATLRWLIDLLAGLKINQLQLYTEHTFAYAGHERVWRGASPMTARQIEALDAYCRSRGVQLVPNQNSFGHMERWLCHEPYARLAETTSPWKTPWGTMREQRCTLNPLDPGSIRLVTSLYDQLLPHFSSRLLNVGCDETWELGQGRSAEACRRRGVGRVYLDFLLKIYRAVRRRGWRMMFWGDIIFQHPELIGRLPRDVIPLIWGYEADHPFAEQCAKLAEVGLTFYVCPGTSSWCSYAGRTRNSLANLRIAADCGRRHGAVGYLVTDWGDFGHPQYLPASFAGFLFGAAVSWCGATNAEIDVGRELGRRVFGDKQGEAGRLWLEAGTVHELADVPLKNRTVLFDVMQKALDWSSLTAEPKQASRRTQTPDGPSAPDLASASDRATTPDQTTTPSRKQTPGRLERPVIRAMLRRIDALSRRAEKAAFEGEEGRLARAELLATLAILRHACRRAALAIEPNSRRRRQTCRELANDIQTIIARHRALWRARNRPGGLASSLSDYRRLLREYRQNM